MRIGVIVDGSAEKNALSIILKNIILPQNTVILKPLYADMQPKAAPGQIARAALSKVHMLLGKAADKIVVLVDLEDRSETPSRFARSIEIAFQSNGFKDLQVVVKNRKFENWLIADPEGLENLPARLNISESFKRQVAPNKADNIHDAEQLLNETCIKFSYRKGKDGINMAKNIDPAQIGLNSRSFRRLLRLLGHLQYADQSCTP